MRWILKTGIVLSLGWSTLSGLEKAARGQEPPSPVPSMPGEMTPSLFPADNAPERSQRLWLRGEYLLWWIKDGNVPPLVTTGPQASLGVPGEPDTQVLYDNTDYGTLSGGRFSAVYWLDPCQRCGVGASYFFLGQGCDDFSAFSPGDPVLARPFINALTGQPDAEQVANLENPLLPALLPLGGRVSVSARSRLWGAEANAIKTCWLGCRSRVEVFGGFRYLSLDEGLLITEELEVPANAPAFAGTRINLFDNFATRNDFYGGQVGTRAELRRGRSYLEFIGKVALGTTQQQVLIDGETLIDDPQLPPPFRGRGGLLAQPTNIGNYDRSVFSVVPEVTLNVGYQVTDGLRAFVGYNFLYWSNVVRPGDQIDPVVNPTQIPPGVLMGPARPAFTFNGDSFWAHGLNFGVELRY